MPCNCGKNRRRPLGATTQTTTAAPPPQTKFTLRTTDGRTQTFGSRLEADAARVRAGGGSIVGA